MRVVKDTEIEYRPFVNPSHFYGDELVSLSAQSKEFSDEEDNSKFKGLKHLIKFGKEIEQSDSILEITGLLNSALKEHFPVDDSQLFLYDKTGTNLKSIGINTTGYLASFAAQINKQGSIDWIFGNDSAGADSGMTTYTVNGNGTKLILIPILQKNKRKGLLLLSSKSGSLSKNKHNLEFVQSLLNLTLLKIETLMYKIQHGELTKELQLYQSKISGDYRLLAIGELAIGAIEGILNPMQVILSSADMIADADNNVDRKAVNIIKEQVNRVNEVISGLIKFARRNNDKLTVQPVNLNRLIKDYSKIIEQSVRNKNYELILDLQNNIPSILSSRNYLYQILTNIFALLLSDGDGDGGILLQTKYSNAVVSIRILSTSYIKSFNAEDKNENHDLSLNIIKNIMNKHDGSLQTNANPESGSTLLLNFPVKLLK